MLDQYWASVVDDGPILVQHWVIVSSVLGSMETDSTLGDVNAMSYHNDLISTRRAVSMFGRNAQNIYAPLIQIDLLFLE